MFYWIVYQHKQSRRTKLLKLQIMQKQSPMIHNSTTSFWRWFFPAIPPFNFATARTRPTRRSIGDRSVEIGTPPPRPHKPVNEAGTVMIVDVRDFNLICGLAESSESGFSTTYCGYPKFVEIRRISSKSVTFSHFLTS